MPTEEHASIIAAKKILRGQAAEPAALLKLAQNLKKANAFRYARKILARALEGPGLDALLRRKLAQELSLCTYKDPDLPAKDRFAQALELLGTIDDLQTTEDQETLGQAGAIYKRKWEHEAQRQHLERSLAYYQRGYAQGVASDYGYTGINAAFVLDLLANQERDEADAAGSTFAHAAARSEEAQRIRQAIVATLPGLAAQPGMEWLKTEWWFLATVAEAYFGLHEYEAAEQWLTNAQRLPGVPDWEFESTARQFAQLALLQENKTATELAQSSAWNVLEGFLGSTEAVHTVFAGKVGLALSGGGFRASLFHIGVLARLADLDMLRHIEVLSCVSGGSIIGAHYYLEVRKLLQTKKDSAIKHEDYIEIVRNVTRAFLAGVQTNIRMRVTAGLTSNLKMLFTRTYSRTERVGELYEKNIFSFVEDGQGHDKRWLNGLYVHPMGEDDQPISPFKPKYDNWRRRNKVPILILNATTLNNGHNWQFTASWMGESPAYIDTNVDGNYRLRRMYYSEAPEQHQQVRLGHAVGASSCVPGLFEPLVLADLYERVDEEQGKVPLTVRLVDGGVHDNQGIVGLMEQDCTVVLVSDASGQMGVQDNPTGGLRGLWSVPLRSNSILMARVREAQYHDLEARRRSALLRGLMFIHLKKDLEVDPVDWVDSKDPYEASDEARSPTRQGRLTRYGIDKQVQEKLAAIRTDLDSFTETEAYALMTSGYRMTAQAFNEHCVQGFPLQATHATAWPFLNVETAMTLGQGSKRLLNLLDVARGRAFKIWKLWLSSPPLRILGILFGIVFVLALFLGLLWGGWLLLAWSPLDRFWSILVMAPLSLVALAIVGWLTAHLHLHLFDALYLRAGKADQFTS